MSDTFDLTTVGFVVGTDTAVSGSAYFDVTDYLNPNNRDRISIDLGDMTASGQVLDYSFASLDLNILATIDASGMLGYTITATKGDFFVNDASLTVDASAQSVPDGASTVALLGIALLGLSAAARKFGFTS
jgi:hypothetical protein